MLQQAVDKWNVSGASAADFLPNGCRFAFVDHGFLVNGMRRATHFSRTLATSGWPRHCASHFLRTSPILCPDEDLQVWPTQAAPRFLPPTLRQSFIPGLLAYILLPFFLPPPIPCSSSSLSALSPVGQKRAGSMKMLPLRRTCCADLSNDSE